MDKILLRWTSELEGANPVPRTYVRGFGALPFGEVQNIHPRTHGRGVLWYGAKVYALMALDLCRTEREELTASARGYT